MPLSPRSERAHPDGVIRLSISKKKNPRAGSEESNVDSEQRDPRRRLAAIAMLFASTAMVLLAGLLLAMTALVGTVWSETTSGPQSQSSASSASGPSSAPTPAPPGAQYEKLSVNPPPLYGVKNPHGTVVDAFVPADLTVKVGKPVVITVLNYDSMPHTWTASGLGVNEMVPAGSAHSPSKVTFTFTPKSAGSFTWQCETPCNSWSMTHVGYMEGTVTVTQ